MGIPINTVEISTISPQYDLKIQWVFDGENYKKDRYTVMNSMTDDRHDLQGCREDYSALFKYVFRKIGWVIIEKSIRMEKSMEFAIDDQE